MIKFYFIEVKNTKRPLRLTYAFTALLNPSRSTPSMRRLDVAVACLLLLLSLNFTV